MGQLHLRILLLFYFTSLAVGPALGESRGKRVCKGIFKIFFQVEIGIDDLFIIFLTFLSVTIQYCSVQ